VLKHLGTLESVEKLMPEHRTELERLKLRMRPKIPYSGRSATAHRTTTMRVQSRPEAEIDAFHTKVLALVKTLPAPFDRKAILQLAEAEHIEPVGRRNSLADDVGKALTHLHTWGLVVRRGLGGRRHPYKYGPLSIAANPV
jgi:hypothetical protein